MNNAGSERHFDSHEDANRAYALLCDYEAFLSDLVNTGQGQTQAYRTASDPEGEGNLHSGS